MNQTFNIFRSIGLNTIKRFDLLAKTRSIYCNGDEKPIENGIVSGVRVNWEHYGKVLEAKNHQFNNS